jgi:hypothetical protein
MRAAIAMPTLAIQVQSCYVKDLKRFISHRAALLWQVLSPKKYVNLDTGFASDHETRILSRPSL